MQEFDAQSPVVAEEVPKRNTRTVAIFVIMIVMATLLGTSLLLYLINAPDNNGGNGSIDPEDQTELVLQVNDWPDQLQYVNDMSISGEVKDVDGTRIPDIPVAVNIPDISDRAYRTVSDPEGRFIIDFDLPLQNESSLMTVNVSVEKDGYQPTSQTRDIEYISPDTWTFMIYMSDCDLETWALKDINELESIPENDLVNIIVQLDRWESRSSTDDISNGNWTTTKRFLITEDDDNNIINSEELEDLGEINSADPDELVDFAVSTMNDFPADIYSLILWNHGSGVDGICWEQSLDNEEVITISQLGEAFDEITDRTDTTLDIIGFDACLMSAIEVAYEISPYGDLMIGSEITEPAFGWDYKTIGELQINPYLTTSEFSELLIDDYMEQKGTLGSKNSLSMGVYNLSQTEDIAIALSELSTTITEAGSTELYNVRIARLYAQDIQDGHSSDAVDLYDFLENIMSTTENSQIKAQCQTVLDLIEESVIYFEKAYVTGMSISGLNGFSIYAPDFREVYDSNEDYSDLKFTQDSTWEGMLLAYYDHLNEFLEAKVLDFETPLISCTTTDEDGDGFRDTMRYTFTITSSENDTASFLGLNVYNLRGEKIADLGLNITVSTGDPQSFTVVFSLDPEDGGPGLYRISAYLCKGSQFDMRFYQDFTRSGYRWLENKN